jgi:berberine-like enzyme
MGFDGFLIDVQAACSRFCAARCALCYEHGAEWNANEVHEAEKHMHWARTFQAAIQPFTAKGVYSNFLGDEGEEQVRASYGVKYERLVALKIRCDPTNFFRFNKKTSTKAHPHR